MYFSACYISIFGKSVFPPTNPMYNHIIIYKTVPQNPHSTKDRQEENNVHIG